MNTWFLALVLATGGGGADLEPLTFEDRVRAEASLLRVTQAHQIGDDRQFAEAVPRAILERRVRDYLGRSVALETLWDTPVTGEMLDREVARIARETAAPARLAELFAALDGDPRLVRECLARRTLVQRLTEGFFAWDPSIHARERERADALRLALLRRQADPPRDGVDRHELVLLGPGAAPPPDRGSERIDWVELDRESFDDAAAAAPALPGDVEGVHEERDRFVVRRLLERDERRLRFEVFEIPKRSWSSWWDEVGAGLDLSHVEAPGTPAPLPEISGGAGPQCEQDVWRNGILDDRPAGLIDPNVFWTGSTMIVFGTSYGALYDPATDVWTSMKRPPWSLGSYVAAAWTGAEMIAWGTLRGGRYDPLADAWTPVSDAGAPSNRWDYAVAWTGTEMIVWGGWGNGIGALATGARYDPSADAWAPVANAGAPSARLKPTMVWTGSRLLVWGGESNSAGLGDGARYDPATNSWSLISGSGAPTARRRHTAVWTGSAMIVWGGAGATSTNTGGRYDPVGNLWQPTSTTGAPSARDRHTAVWTGSEMVVWGGGFTDSGGRYDPVADAWLPLAQTGAPVSRSYHGATWTGSRMIVWGGRRFTPTTALDTGGRYDPSSDVWTPTSTGPDPAGPPTGKAVWTGTEMIVWGGGRGARYDPTLDAWATVAQQGAPTSTNFSDPVWTGREMIVPDGGGGRYDPLGDTWSAMSLVGAPSFSYYATAWTGDFMLVWSAQGIYTPPSCGAAGVAARYDPWLDRWTPLSSVGAPEGRLDPSSVWTGTEWIVWGGNRPTFSWPSSCADFPAGTGGRYDPALDRWSPMQGSVQRRNHATTWTGAELFVWGGRAPTPSNSGDIYYTAGDYWLDTHTLGAPGPREFPVAVWTGTEALVWGGTVGAGEVGGARFHLADSTWAPISSVDEPFVRPRPAVVWTGSSMIVWGGGASSGGRYVLENDLDDDGLCGAADPCPDDAGNDADGDGRCAAADNCPTVANADQTDSETSAAEIGQWATTARASSQLSGTAHSAQRATGPPENPGACTGVVTNWAPATGGSGPEWIELGYATPVHATGVRVHESQLGGFVHRVDLRDTGGNLHSVWTGTDATPCGGVFAPTWPATPYLVVGARILTQVDQYEQIDAVELIGRLGADGVGDACDNCPAIHNPSQERVVFGPTVVAAADGSSLAWGEAHDVDFVVGDLALVASYATTTTGSAAAATGLEITADDPGPGEGRYYLVRYGGACGSWQTAPGAQPARDGSLP